MHQKITTKPKWLQYAMLKAANFPLMFAFKLLGGWEGWGLEWGDCAAIVKTRDIQHLDIALAATPYGIFLGRLHINSPDEVTLAWPDDSLSRTFPVNEVYLIGRAFLFVRRDCEAPRLPFEVRPFFITASDIEIDELPLLGGE